MLNNGITVLLLVVFDMKAEGVVLGTLIADFLMTLVVFFRLKKRMILKIEKIFLKSLSHTLDRYSFMPFWMRLASVNRLILNNLVSIETVGVYTIGFTIAGVVNMITVALNHSYTPWFYSQMKKRKEIIVILLDLLSLLFSFIQFFLYVSLCFLRSNILVYK